MLAIIEQQVAGLLAFAFYFFYDHLLSSLRTILFHLHKRRNIFVTSRKTRWSASRVEDDYSRQTQISKCALLICGTLFIARWESYSRDRRGPATALECSSGLGSGSAYRSHAANSRDTKRNRTFNIAFTCGTAAGPARRSPTHTCTCPRVNTRRPVPLSRALHSVSTAMYAEHVW